MFDWQSPYVVFNNNPILYSDPSGAVPGDGDGTRSKRPPLFNRNDPNNFLNSQKDNGSSGDKWWQGWSFSFSTKGESNYSNSIVFDNVINQARAGMMGAANAFGSNMMMGMGRQDPSSLPSYMQTSARLGQMLGDVATVIRGVGEVATGIAGEISGCLMDASLVLALPGAALNALSAAIATHGVTSISIATQNLAININELNNGNFHNGNGNSETVWDGRGESISFDNSGRIQKMGKQKKSKAEKMPDDAAKELGIKDVKKFKKYLHSRKLKEGRRGADNYTWDELIEMGKEFKQFKEK